MLDTNVVLSALLWNGAPSRLLDAQQRDAFEAIAGGMQARLGYAGRPEYVVNY